MMRDNKNGQVGIVVTILVVSLFVSVIVIIQVYYVPQWMKDKEADHMDIVANQFANLKFSIDLQAMSKADIPITTSITLGSKELPYFMSSRAFGSLQILPPSESNFGIYVTPSSGRMREIYQPDPASSGEIDYVTQISKLDLLIDTLTDGDIFNLSINGNKNLEVRIVNDANGFRIALKTINNAQIIFNQTIASALPQEAFIINLLNPDYKFFTDVLPYIPTPYTISFNGTSSNGNFIIKCMRFGNPSSSSIQYSLGIIEYQSENVYFVDQTYIYEGGAVVLSQTLGEAIISSPPFSAINYTTKHILNVSFVDIKEIPGKTSATGYGTYSIRTNYSSATHYLIIAKGVNITVYTEQPSAWGRYFQNFFNASSITNFTVVVNESQNYVVVTLNGPQGGNAYDIELSLNKIEVYAQVGPGWVS